MALSTSQLAAITHRLILPQLVETIFLSNPLLFRLKNKGIKYDGGRTIVQPLAYAKTSSAGAYKGYDLLATAANDQLTAAEYEWRQQYANVTISGEEELKNSGKSAIRNLLEAKRQMAELTLMDNLGTGLQGSNTSGKDIDGLGLTLSDTSTYGNIAVADLAEWKAKVRTLAVAGTLTKLEIQKAQGAATVGSDKPTVMVTRQSVFDKVWSLWEGQQRFEDSSMADAGFQNIRVNGTPLVVDSHVPGSDGGTQDNFLEFLNERYLWLAIHSDVNFKVVPIPPQRDQDVKMARILWAGNLLCSRRNMQAVIKTIDPNL